MTNPLQLLSGLGRRLLKRDSFNSAPEGPASTSEGRGGPWAQAWTRLRHKKVALGALIVVVLLYGVGALAPLTAPRDYRETPSTNLEELPGFQGLVMSPNWSDDSTLYNYTPVGVFRSENAGGSWTQVVSGLGAVNVDVLVPVPSEGLEEVVYAGTPQGVFVSRDGASSWAPANVGLPDNLGINHIAVSPVFHADGTLIAALSGGLFRSADRGTTWTNVSNGFQGDSPAASTSSSPPPSPLTPRSSPPLPSARQAPSAPSRRSTARQTAG